MANNNTWQVIQTAPFIGGLNTEINDLQDATQFTSSELNMVIKNNGTRARRLGIDYEEGYELSRYTVASPKDETAFSMSEWTSFKDAGDEVMQYIKSQPLDHMNDLLMQFQEFNIGGVT
jgi:hypothetical protein